MKTDLMDWKVGWIEEIDDDLVICTVRKDYEIDDCLTFGRNTLTSKQNELVQIGQIIKYNKNNCTILFAVGGNDWC